MTREKAYKSLKDLIKDKNELYTNIYSYVEFNEADRLLDEIYDDFENRTCENCKHWKQYENDEYGKCVNKKINEDFLDTEGECNELNYYDCYPVFEPIKNFGCNRFERKEQCQ